MYNYCKDNKWRIFGILFIITIPLAIGYMFVGDGNVENGLFFYTPFGRAAYIMLTIMYWLMVITLLINLTIVIRRLGRQKALHFVFSLLLLIITYCLVLAVFFTMWYLHGFVVSGAGF